MENSLNAINCETNLIRTWPANCFIIANTIDSQVPTFAITDAKLYVLDVTLSNQDNAKLLNNKNQVLRELLTGINIGGDYITSCLLNYVYFQNYCKIIAIDLSKQQTFDADPKAIQ